jgi:hypothetical protein
VGLLVSEPQGKPVHATRGALADMSTKLTTDSQRKLRIAARWMNDLRRTLDHLVKAVINYRDLQSNENSIRTEVAEALEPLILILHDCLIHSRRHFDGKAYPN